MSRKYKLGVLVVLLIAVVGLLVHYLTTHDIAVLSPAGVIGQKEKHLIAITTLLAVVVIVPVFILTGYIVWNYRETNKKPKKYSPNWDHDARLEFIWWAVPLAIITILAFITWNSSHALDPSKTLSSNQKPLPVQVVALQWKWLFIYPEQNIATVNLVQFPVNTPINFQITSDAPMNSFWIPKLGGQIYAMSGMTTQLHLMADQTGDFAGSSANISGRGFAGMKFTAKATNQADFDKWVKTVKQSPNKLSLNQYSQLAQPSENNQVAMFGSSAANLYDDVIMQYMMPGHQLGVPVDNMAGMDNHVNY